MAYNLVVTTGLIVIGATQVALLVEYLDATNPHLIQEYDATMGTCVHDLVERRVLQLDLD